MSDFAPPAGPPPPQVPDGWKAVYNQQYQEWFYVNLHTKQSQWNKPTEPAYAVPEGAPPPGAPPSYDHNTAQDLGPEKGANNPFLSQQQSGAGPSSQITDDEALARKIQAEEQSRVGSRGASDGYYAGGQQAPQAPTYGSGQYGEQVNASSAAGATATSSKDKEKSRGLFSKLSSKLGGSSSSKPQGYGGYPTYARPQQGYGQPGYGGGYGPQPGYGAPYGGGYGGYPGGGYPPQGGYYQQRPQRQGMGAGGGAALGLGAGLLGGALIAESFDNDDGGGDDGGGDDGGGDDG